MAIAPLLEESKTPLIVMNAATSSIVEKSPYIVRTSFTMWQNTVPAAKIALKNGAKKVAIAVSDYGPGVDAEAAFKKTFEGEGGAVVEAIRIPLATTDFSPIMQRIKDSGADTIFTFLPSGPPTLGFVKAYNDNGLKAGGVKLMSTGDVVTEPDLPNIGDAGLGILSTYHYSVSHDSKENTAFLATVKKGGGNLDEVPMTSVAAYDGTRLIYKMIEATDGKHDAAKAVDAVKDMKWVSAARSGVDRSDHASHSPERLSAQCGEGGRQADQQGEPDLRRSAGLGAEHEVTAKPSCRGASSACDLRNPTLSILPTSSPAETVRFPST